MVWVNYHQEFKDRFKEEDGFICDHNRSKLPIFVARTLHVDHFVPGYAANGVGYFVSDCEERLPFQTTSFQVLVGAKVAFSKSHERGIVTDEDDIITRHLIGSFYIEKKRFCGLVEDKKSCYINFDGQVVKRDAPHFEFIADFYPPKILVPLTTMVYSNKTVHQQRIIA
ncbi:Hypothetical predicted protein [Cloeon dipterum]|uniref:Uncharacterized protein n=1 Tax=Cloeon dipterum TaxID=197152 RepID=A0A8S1DX36_9INSE|nr:Hypothetical predicted protein [Cloeon dipterum]